VSPRGEAIAPEEADRQLFLISPPALAADRFAVELDAALSQDRVAGFLLRLDDPGQAPVLAPSLQQVCRARGIAFLVDDDLPLALELGADGLHLSRTTMMRAARGALGEDRIIGAACGTSRHQAMTAGEEGADYVGFGTLGRPVDEELIGLLGWWSELFVLPCLACAESGPEAASILARAGADFVAIREDVWQHPRGPAAGVRAICDVIAAA
jgi:thiamine-phosphate pyrophosphorylase